VHRDFGLRAHAVKVIIRKFWRPTINGDGWWAAGKRPPGQQARDARHWYEELNKDVSANIQTEMMINGGGSGGGDRENTKNLAHRTCRLLLEAVLHESPASESVDFSIIYVVHVEWRVCRNFGNSAWP
jgi:hypothetical protein